jgi:hypothetical protein
MSSCALPIRSVASLRSAAAARAFSAEASPPFPTLLVVDPQGNLVKHRGEHTVRAQLMNTDKAVKRHFAALKKAGTDAAKFKKAAAKIAKKGDTKAAFALNQFIYGEGADPTPEQVAAIAAVIIQTKGDYAIGFFLGKHGVGSEDKATRLASLKALRGIGTRQTLFSLLDSSNAEKDEDVKKAFQETMKALDAKK